MHELRDAGSAHGIVSATRDELHDVRPFCTMLSDCLHDLLVLQIGTGRRAHEAR